MGAVVLTGEVPSGGGLCRADDWAAECRRRDSPFGRELAEV